MRFVYPAKVDDDTLVSTTVPEDDHPEYGAETSYATGDRVIFRHQVYQSLSDINTSLQPDISPLAWTLIGPTNAWAMFDLTQGTSTVAADEISVSFVLDQVDALAMTEVVGDEIVISVDDATSLQVYERIVTLNGEPASIYLADLPPSDGMAITVTVTRGSGDCKVSGLIMGSMLFMGETSQGLQFSISDYSLKTQDEFGNTTLTRRGFSRRMDASVRLDNSTLDQCVQLLAAIRSTAVVWIGTDTKAASFVIGYYRDWDIDIAYFDCSDCSLSVEGLVQTDEFSFEDVAAASNAVGDLGYSGGVVSITGGAVDPDMNFALEVTEDGDAVTSVVLAPGPDFLLEVTEGADTLTSTAEPPSAGATDPHWSNVELLIHADTTIADVSSRGRTLTFNGAYSIDTTVKKFGAGSLLVGDEAFSGAPDYISCGSVTLAGDFTLEYQAYAGENEAASISLVSNIGELQLYYSPGYGANIYNLTNDTEYVFSNDPGDGWHHIAWSRTSGVNRLFVDGVLAGTWNNGTTLTVSAIRIGTTATYASDQWYSHYDEIRLTSSVSRYSSAFTPPTEAFPNS